MSPEEGGGGDTGEPEVAGRYVRQEGRSYHRGSPRSRMLDARLRGVRSEYVRHVLSPHLPADAERTLEFGAGFGQNLLHMPGRERVAYEPSPYAREIASGYPELTVVGSLDGMAERSFDLVLSYHSLEHTVEPYRELRRLHDLLRPGGTLLCVVPCERDEPHRASDPNAHLYSWTRLTLGNLVAECGFSVEASEVIHRSLEFRLSPVRRVSPGLWVALSRLAGRALGRKDLLVRARRPSGARTARSPADG